jgi:hypothetical protein
VTGLSFTLSGGWRHFTRGHGLGPGPCADSSPRARHVLVRATFRDVLVSVRATSRDELVPARASPRDDSDVVPSAARPARAAYVDPGHDPDLRRRTESPRTVSATARLEKFSLFLLRIAFGIAAQLIVLPIPEHANHDNHEPWIPCDTIVEARREVRRGTR